MIDYLLVAIVGAALLAVSWAEARGRGLVAALAVIVVLSVFLPGCASPEPPPGKLLGHGYNQDRPAETLRRVLQDQQREASRWE